MAGRRSARRRIAAAAVAVAALAAGCASSGGHDDASTSSGWLDGAPSERSAGGARGATGSTGSARARPGAPPAAMTKADEGAATGASTAAPQRASLRAGSVDDNQKFVDYLAYRTRVAGLGVVPREIDPTGRTILQVVGGSDGLPSVNRRVVVTRSGAEVASLTTTADGTVRFMPRAYPGDASAEATASVDGTRIALEPGGSQRLVLRSASAPTGTPKLDVLFLLDTTGSMGDEIDRLKGTIDAIARRVAELTPAPEVRFGMTVYRDLKDAYVTRTFDLTGDVAAFSDALAKVRAGGGGDTPEALDEALAASLDEPAWRDDAMKLIFLVADAGPHVERQVQSPYTDSVRDAASRGIKIFPVASSNSDDLAEVVFRQIAQFTGARFVFLSYGAGGAALGGSTDIDSTDYEELALDDLVVRLIAEELAARLGTTVSVPKPPVPTTTNPPGQ